MNHTNILKINDFFNLKIITQKLSSDKKKSERIEKKSCYKHIIIQA